MNNLNEEITRTKEAIAKTSSPHLKRDYEKHLKKLYAQKKKEQYKRNA